MCLPSELLLLSVRFCNHSKARRFVEFTRAVHAQSLGSACDRLGCFPLRTLFLNVVHRSHTRRCGSHTNPAVLALPPLPTITLAEVKEFLTYRKPVCNWPRGGLSLHHCLCKNHNCSCCPGTHGPHWPAAWHFSCGYQLRFSSWELRLLQL